MIIIITIINNYIAITNIIISSNMTSLLTYWRYCNFIIDIWLCVF